MYKIICLILIALTSALIVCPREVFGNFISSDTNWECCLDDQNSIVVASPGRSGSTLLCSYLYYNTLNKTILKTHRLVPKNYQGKTLFVFSNPDVSAESALHMFFKYEEDGWAGLHFMHLFSSDMQWLANLGSVRNQIISNNLLSYDALGIGQHLLVWLHEYYQPSTAEEANILVLKYENLWDPETIQAIRDFTGLQDFNMPEYKPRGYSTEDLDPLEISFREALNQGTPEQPIYKAYDFARALWNQEPPFRYLKY